MQLIVHMLFGHAFIGDQPKHDQHVTETLLTSINSVKEFKKHATFENVTEEDGDIVLANTKHNKGSLINFNNKLKTHNFSIKLKLDHMVLKDSEVSGVYVWFTEDKLKAGTIKNGPSVFKGFMGGIEFSHYKARFVFSYNHGEDYKDTQHYTILYDKIDASKLEAVPVLTLKLIHTESNIKFELYDGERLLTDTFKINDPELVKMDASEYNLGMTSYYEDAKSEILLELKGIEVFERNEGEEYNNMDMHTIHNTHKRTESQHTVVEATANVAHFLNYLTVALGGLGHSTLQKMVISFKDDLKELSNKADNVIEDASKTSNEDSDDETDEKLNKIEDDMHEIYRVIKNMRMELNNLHTSHTKHHNHVGKGVLCFGIFFTLATIAKIIYTRNINERKTLRSLE